MLLGILSDTHGHVQAATAGVEALRLRGVETFIHCGDVGSTDVLATLAGFDASFVFGNCDWDRAELRRYAVDIGIRCLDTGGALEYGGRRIFVTHGDDRATAERAIAAGVDYLFVGHTHVAGERTAGSTRVINPGALYRASVKTVALLDLANDQVEWLTVPVPK